MCWPGQQQGVTTAKRVILACAPIVGSNKTNNWNNLDAFLTGVTDYSKSTKNFKGSIHLLEELYEGNMDNLDPSSKNRLLISLAWHYNQSNQPIRSLGYLGKITEKDLDQ